MKRKTIDVNYLKAFANNMLAGADPMQKEVRLGVSVMIEDILHRTGNYQGFRYLNWGADDYDSTRRVYF